MSVHQVYITRELAELLVDLLEENYESGTHFYHSGEGVEFAAELREQFGMMKQPKLVFTGKDAIELQLDTDLGAI